MKHTGSVPGRFGGFAAGHFTLSVLGFVGWLLLAGAGEFPAFPVYVGALMLLYVPAGWVVSRLLGWPLPNRKTAVKAVLCPALCAWIWAFGGLWLFSFGGTLPSVGYLGFQILLSTFLLASPSALFMLLFVGHIPSALSMAWWGAGWYGAMVLAGLLPPLLFFLGSLLPRASREGCSHENGKNAGASASPVRHFPHPHSPAPGGD